VLVVNTQVRPDSASLMSSNATGQMFVLPTAGSVIRILTALMSQTK